MRSKSNTVPSPAATAALAGAPAHLSKRSVSCVTLGNPPPACVTKTRKAGSPNLDLAKFWDGWWHSKHTGTSGAPGATSPAQNWGAMALDPSAAAYCAPGAPHFAELRGEATELLAAHYVVPLVGLISPPRLG